MSAAIDFCIRKLVESQPISAAPISPIIHIALNSLTGKTKSASLAQPALK